MGRINKVIFPFPFVSVFVHFGCQDLVPHDTRSLLFPKFHRSEIFDLLAGFGTTFAAMPDLIAMLRRRSSAGTNPTMATIMGVFRTPWVYYGLYAEHAILTRPCDTRPSERAGISWFLL